MLKRPGHEPSNLRVAAGYPDLLFVRQRARYRDQDCRERDRRQDGGVDDWR